MNIYNQKGFSLLELLIYTAILAIVTVVIAGAFTTLNRGRGRSEAQVEVNSNLRFAIDLIAQDLRSATAISVPATANATSSSLSAIVSGVAVNYCITSSTLRRQSAGACSASSEAVTSNLVLVDSLLFTRLENTNATLSKTIISIETSLALSYNSSSPDWQYSSSKKTTVALY
ncbi:MAG: prepilin-type N-terminal cleavage/methylation domain-containing protein [Candidatus Paceibacterota bacterium]|jgi:prepilin-type N-terminal cleavage/methylation domain-containing protein